MHSTKCGIGLPGIVIIVVVTVVVIVIVIIVVVVIIIIVVIAIFTSVTLVSLMDALSDVDSGIPSPSDAAAPAVDVPVPDLGGLSDAASSGDLLAGLSDAVTEGDGDGPGDDKVEASVDASLCHTRRNGGGTNAIPLSDWMVDVTRPSNKKRMNTFGRSCGEKRSVIRECCTNRMPRCVPRNILGTGHNFVVGSV